MSKDLRIRFERFVHRQDGCWEWTGARTGHGYGAFNVGGRTLGAHRISYQIYVGSIPDDLQIDHLCRNKICVNPAHLELVTCLENVRRSLPYKPAPVLPERCPQGHVYSPENTFLRRDGNGYQFRRCRECSRLQGRRFYAKQKGELQ